MPDPKEGETRDEWMDRCIPFLIKNEDKTQEQAAGQCGGMYDSWKKKNKFAFEPPESGDAPQKVKDILNAAYTDCRQRWVDEHPKDKENQSNKESCAKQAWAAVKNAGWTKTEDGWQKATKAARNEPETYDIDGVEIAAVGTWDASTGKIGITEEDIDEMIYAYNEVTAKGESNIPIKLGHDDNQKLLQKDGYPSAGWVKNLRKKADKMLGDFKAVPKVIYKIIQGKGYTSVSPEIYKNYKDTNNGKIYKRLLDSVALLGTEHKAMTTLKDLVSVYSREDGTQEKIMFSIESPEIKERYSNEPYDQDIDDSLVAELIATTNFAGSPRSKYGTHASKGFKGSYAAAWRCHFSKIGGGATTGGASGPIRGTVRRTAMIAAGMKPPCSLPGTESVGARKGPKSPLNCSFPSKPSDYGLSSWASPSDDNLNQEDIRLSCSDLAVIKKAALAEIKRRAADRENKEKMSKQLTEEEYMDELERVENELDEANAKVETATKEKEELEKSLNEANEELEKFKKDSHNAKVDAFIEKYKNEKKILPSQEDNIRKNLDILAEKEVVKFSKDGKEEEGNAFDLVGSILDLNPDLVELDEFSRETEDNNIKGETKESDGTPMEDVEEAAKVAKFMKEHDITDGREGYDRYRREGGE